MNIISHALGRGFSKSNPYHIVSQGRMSRTSYHAVVQADLLAKITALIGIIKTTNYSSSSKKSRERRSTNNEQNHFESGQKLTGNAQISRLIELEAEKKELKEFQDKDKERGCPRARRGWRSSGKN